MRSASVSARATCAVMLAVLLALRSLAPAGFMPVFDHGRVMIVACPDADGAAAPMDSHHHHSADHRALHQPCPYASASALGALGPDLGEMLQALFFGVTLALGAIVLFVVRQGLRERPPSRAPPLPA